MRRTAILLAAFLFMTFTSAYGLEFHGLNIPDHFAVDNQTLALNGCGLRTKFFFKIYAGALYTPVKVTQPTQLYRNDLPKVIRMQFIYHRVSASQMRGTYSDDFDDVKPGFSSTSEGQAFLNAFRFDVPEGDVVSLVFHADGALDITH
ncbi:MAG TPA: chalcone isomerase family protein, partial [Desulfuromonadales bacterium]|nr:chalcone isomerase family protein [Desulfuromonadales bacterium]